MPRPSSKEMILDAAEDVVIEEGASHMTLDAVAERSGISKGGLMYNFPTKEALLEGMVNRMSARFDERREQIRQELPPGTANELMVEIRTLQVNSLPDHRLSAALLAVTANQPELTRSLREVLRKRFFDAIVSPDDFIRSSILFFAAMGLHFHNLLNCSLLDDEQMDAVFNELLRLANSNEAI